MAPRRQHAVSTSSGSPVISRFPSQFHCCDHHVRIARRLLILLCGFCVLFRVTAAEIDHDPTPLRVLSGSSYRAFSNRFRRHLRDKNDCLVFHEGGAWWRYEWCLNRYVRQFHNETLATEWSFTLGKFSTAHSKTVRIERANAQDPDVQRDPETRGYVATQHYVDGEVCDGEPRQVTIIYKCCVVRANESYIEAIDEPTTCNYTLSVCTPVACGLLRHDQYAFGMSRAVSEAERRSLLQTVKDMFYHAYHGYMNHAFPLDALRPIACRGETFELGKIPMLTLIDTLDTLAIFEDRDEFQRAVGFVIERATFDIDTEVSVFETTIRVLGGLLSAHLLAIEPSLQLFPPGRYQNELLALAIDLADRLLPAFNTTTGIPYGTVNLRNGVPRGETPIASTAGAGSLSMEFTMLSVLTSNATYATASRRAVRALFDRRSRVGLLGKHIDTATGDWTETSSGPGSNSDSFYEYLWKMYATFNDREMLEMFDSVYASVMACNRHGDWFSDVSMWSGCGNSNGVIFENLVAFWPGLQASLGHVDAAAQSLNAFYRVWRDYGFVPEQFNVLTWKPVRGSGRYPLRPELIESTFYLHEATHDATWLRAGAHVVHSLQKHTKTKCGYASVRDVETKELEDNMPSFFLSETCKYLYLLFNTTHFMRNGNYVFTTEAHPFPVLPAERVEPVLLPTSDVPVPKASTTSQRMCQRLEFWHPHSYAVDYEGVVVDRTERCAKPTSPKKATQATEETTTGTIDWLAMLEKQLRAHLGKKKTDTNDGELLQQILSVDVNGAIDANAKNPTDEFMAKLNEKLRQSWLDNGDEYNDDPPRYQFLNGGGRLGLFRMDQTSAVTRFTRQDTGEWLETTGVEDARFTLVSWLPERRGFSGPVVESDVDLEIDEELPLLLPHHRVYDFVHGRESIPRLRLCTLNVDVDIDYPAFENDNPYQATIAKTTKSFSFSCASASFGAMPLDHGVHRVAAAPMLVTEPLDACIPLKTTTLLGKIAIVKRGECYFETKVRNAVMAGAVAVIVVNHEDEDRVMVMSGAAGADEDDNEVLEPHDKQQSVAVPVIMVPRRAGQWLYQQIVKNERTVRGQMELSVDDSEQDKKAYQAFLDAETDVDKAAKDDPTRRQLAQRKHELALASHPRMDVDLGKLGHIRIMAPEWGIDLAPVNQPNSDEFNSWLIEIVEARPASTTSNHIENR